MNSIRSFASSLLLGTTLEEKLEEPGELDFSSGSSTFELNDIPTFPGRPANLSIPGKATFPALHKLHNPSVRGEVLHFFANHELLAMELMALVLLRFPDAPEDFRQGIVRTIGEEQSHLRLYLSRMKELGVSFGDLPVSDYFWKTMKGMQSPMDFVVQMSLTFEQANLDFSLFYMNAVKNTGDEKTAEVLEKVYREEIGHVKHGLTWFNRWRDEKKESEWETYSRLLPLPMTPQRAKGHDFSVEARRSVGFSEEYIRKLSLYHGSKGRPPVVWFYNPHCDSEIARGKPGFTATEGARRLSQDLQCMPLFLATEQDVILIESKPSENWVADLQAAGFKTPELCEEIRAPKIGGLEPWGWSPDSFSMFRRLKEKLVDTSDGNSLWSRRVLERKSYQETGFGKLFSKSWSADFLHQWMSENPSSEFGKIDTLGRAFSTLDQVLKRIEEIFQQQSRVMLKAPYGTSGMQLKEVRSLLEIKEMSPLYGWIKGVLETQGSLVIEPHLNKVADFSTQMEIEAERTEIFDARFFLTGPRNEYRGSYLGKKPAISDEEQTRYLFSTREMRTRLLRDLAHRLRSEGYQGPVGVDSLLYRDENNQLKLKAIVEINPRWTMGRVALELEKKFAPGVPALWLFLPVKAILAAGFQSAEDFADEVKRRHPLKTVQVGGGARIESGVVFTNDPAQAREVLTIAGDYEALTLMILNSATSTSPLSVSFKAGTKG